MQYQAVFSTLTHQISSDISAISRCIEHQAPLDLEAANKLAGCNISARAWDIYTNHFGRILQNFGDRIGKELNKLADPSQSWLRETLCSSLLLFPQPELRAEELVELATNTRALGEDFSGIKRVALREAFVTEKPLEYEVLVLRQEIAHVRATLFSQADAPEIFEGPQACLLRGCLVNHTLRPEFKNPEYRTLYSAIPRIEPSSALKAASSLYRNQAQDPNCNSPMLVNLYCADMISGLTSISKRGREAVNAGEAAAQAIASVAEFERLKILPLNIAILAGQLIRELPLATRSVSTAIVSSRATDYLTKIRSPETINSKGFGRWREIANKLSGRTESSFAPDESSV